VETEEQPTRPLRVLLVHPGASWSTADVYDGLLYGLRYHGITVITYRLDTRIEYSQRVLNFHWRQRRKQDPSLQRPSPADIVYHAASDAVVMALREQVDVVLIVSAMLLHPDLLVVMKRAHLPVVILFTESPYDHAKEKTVAALVEGAWTNERSVVQDFRRVNPNVTYLPHGWHPHKHFPAPDRREGFPSHDVLFVGSAFPERVKLFSAIDWTGIDLAIYGAGWDLLPPDLERTALRGTVITNEDAAALYRRAKICLSLYRQHTTDTDDPIYAESLSPRAYELAACGAFHLSEPRAEVAEYFGARVPIFTSPAEAGDLIRTWLADDDGRARVAAELPACVAEASWINRATTVIGDLARLLRINVAA